MLGISHPTVDTRDVALYYPFRVALSAPNELIGLQTLMWRLMKRKIRKDFIDSVSFLRAVSNRFGAPAYHLYFQLEDARASMDLYRSDAKNWEGTLDFMSHTTESSD